MIKYLSRPAVKRGVDSESWEMQYGPELRILSTFSESKQNMFRPNGLRLSYPAVINTHDCPCIHNAHDSVPTVINAHDSSS